MSIWALVMLITQNELHSQNILESDLLKAKINSDLIIQGYLTEKIEDPNSTVKDVTSLSAIKVEKIIKGGLSGKELFIRTKGVILMM